jgi:hypothetical protein
VGPKSDLGSNGERRRTDATRGATHQAPRLACNRSSAPNSQAHQAGQRSERRLNATAFVHRENAPRRPSEARSTPADERNEWPGLSQEANQSAAREADIAPPTTRNRTVKASDSSGARLRNDEFDAESGSRCCPCDERERHRQSQSSQTNHARPQLSGRTVQRLPPNADSVAGCCRRRQSDGRVNPAAVQSVHRKPYPPAFPAVLRTEVTSSPIPRWPPLPTARVDFHFMAAVPAADELWEWRPANSRRGSPQTSSARAQVVGHPYFSVFSSRRRFQRRQTKRATGTTIAAHSHCQLSSQCSVSSICGVRIHSAARRAAAQSTGSP